MINSGLQPYLNSSLLTKVNPVVIDINIHILDIGHTGVAFPVLIGCFHIEVGQGAVAVTQLGEGVGAVAHEVMTLLVKGVVVGIPMNSASSFWRQEKGRCCH